MAFNERNYRRTLSAGTTSDDEINGSETNGRRSRLSENLRDTDTIEEMVTCSIHLGIMENPKKLQCQHAFCSDCLISFVKINGSLFCPICRAVEKCDDVTCLPQALVEKQLIEVVMKRRIADCMTPSVRETSLSVTDKTELVKHLLKELQDTSSEIFKIDEHEEAIEISTDVRTDHITTTVKTAASICSSVYDLMDIEIIRENMLKYSSYKDVKRNNISRFCKSNILKKYCLIPPDFSTFDIHLSKEPSKSFELVFVDSNTNKFFVCSETQCRSFFIHLEGAVVRPVFIKILHDDLYVTGVIIDGGVVSSVFLQCNMHGKVLRKSEYCCHNNVESQSMLPMFCGFDVDDRRERYFICMPHSNGIQAYNTSLVECRQFYYFNDNRPEFVTIYRAHNQLWVSCPKDRKILISDIDTGAFMMFGTDQINNAIPKMIYCTDDERVIFLDSHSNRFIWIKRRDDFILTQKLDFRSLSEELTVKAFQVLPYSVIVVGTSNEFFVFQPVKMKSRLKSNLQQCALL